LIKKIFKYSIGFVLLFVAVINLYLIFLLGFFRFVNPPTSAFMQQNDNSSFLNIVTPNTISHEWVPLESISSNVVYAVIASEDQRYLDHFGIDLTEVEKIIEKSMDGKKTRGASTITQQTAKNLFLFPQKIFVRKGIEIYYSFLMELLWGKQRIMETYLNIAQFGENIYGVEAASKFYFKKSAKRMTKNQAAQLASVLPNPIRYKLKRKSRFMLNRIARIERQMNNLDQRLIYKELKE